MADKLIISTREMQMISQTDSLAESVVVQFHLSSEEVKPFLAFPTLEGSFLFFTLESMTRIFITGGVRESCQNFLVYSFIYVSYVCLC